MLGLLYQRRTAISAPLLGPALPRTRFGIGLREEVLPARSAGVQRLAMPAGVHERNLCLNKRTASVLAFIKRAAQTCHGFIGARGQTLVAIFRAHWLGTNTSSPTATPEGMVSDRPMDKDPTTAATQHWNVEPPSRLPH
mmetsp:Transcript_23161/g.65656  ORF Transcript_23161/g.65656 Transcript_23161/m.65656 type:complete len:139 (+) Transcript_23161:1257-1673(+)